MTDAEQRSYVAGQAKALRFYARSAVADHNRINPGRTLAIVEIPLSLSHNITTIIDAYNAVKAERDALKQQLSAAQPSAEDAAAEQQLASVAAAIEAEQAPANPATPPAADPGTTAAPAGPTLMSQVS